LNRTGFLFRQLGYRTVGEMNTIVSPDSKTAESHNLGDFIAVSNTDRFSSIQNKGSATQSAAYVSGFSLYTSGPASKNFGFWAELQPPTESFAAVASPGKGYAVTTGTSTSISPWVRYYNGQSGDNFLFARVGKISIDGFQGNNSSIGSISPTLLTKSSPSLSGDGIELGYLLKNDVITAYVTEPSTSDSGTSTNKAIQYLHFIGKHDSSVQALYETGEAPYVPSYSFSSSPSDKDLESGLPSNATPDGWNDYNALLLYANYRTPVGSNAINLLGGYSTGDNHNKVSTASFTEPGGDGGILEKTTYAGPKIGYHSYYAEFEYEVGSRLIPYVRYDNIHYGAALSSIIDDNEYTTGIAYMVDENIKLNLDYNNNNPEGGTHVNTFQTSVQFLW